MNIHLFKDIKRSDDSYYWFADKVGEYFLTEKRFSDAASSYEDALISIGRAMITNNIKIDKILYEGKQINKEDWNK